MKIWKMLKTYINNKDGGAALATLDVNKTFTYRGRTVQWKTIKDGDGHNQVVLAVVPEN